MSLGRHFPTELLRQQLEPGRVLHLYCDFAGKNKFVVLGSMQSTPQVLVINSRVPPFIANRPALAQCQVTIDQADHTFLNRDSVIDCHEAVEMQLREIHYQVEADPDCIKGMISDEVRSQVVAAIKLAPTISGQHQHRLLTSLDPDTA